MTEKGPRIRWGNQREGLYWFEGGYSTVPVPCKVWMKQDDRWVDLSSNVVSLRVEDKRDEQR